MVTKITNHKQNKLSEAILEELQTIKRQLEKFLILIPEESIKEYKNSRQIKEAYLKSLKAFPPE
jgi:ElaB/YqjD/DUF883 family membrane-anchored ribosome-binding protein